MNNGAHYIFVDDVMRRAKSDSVIMSVVKHLVDRLEKAVAAEDESIKILRKNFRSDDLAEADRERDALYSSYKKGVEAFLKMPVKEMAEAAKVLSQHIKEYAIDTKAEQHKESGMLANFVGDLEGKYAQHVAKLSLTPLVAALKEANDRVREADRDRTDDRIATQVGATKAARAESDEAYRALAKMVNALALVATLPNGEGDEKYWPFIDYVNQQITQYKRTVLGQKADKPETSPGGGSGDTGDTGGSGQEGGEPGTGGGTGSGGSGGDSGDDSGDDDFKTDFD